MVEDITDEGLVCLHQKNKFEVGDDIEIMAFSGENIMARVEAIYDERLNPMPSAPHPKQQLFIKLDDITGVKNGMVIRLKHCEA